MILYIVRHGIAVDRGDPKSPPDAERPLTAKGMQKTRSAALGLEALGAKPDVLVTSLLVRAAQTAEIFAEAIGYPPEKIQISENLKPDSRAAETVREFQKMKAKEVMCFGHGPHVDLLISYLAGSRGVFTALKKAGVACFEHQSVHGKWELLWYVTPKILRALGD